MAFTFGNTTAGGAPGAAPSSFDLHNDGRSTPPPLPGGGGSSSYTTDASAAGGVGGGGGGLFNFGTSSAAAPAAARPSFNFGSAAGAAPAPSATAPTVAAAAPAFGAAPAAGGGFGLSSAAHTTGSPAAPLFSAAPAVVAATITAHAHARATAPPPPPPPNPSYVKVPEFNATFPGEGIWKRIFHALAKAENGDDFAGQELVQLLKCNTANSRGSGGNDVVGGDGSDGLEASVGDVLLFSSSSMIWKMESANPHIRQQLATQQMVVLQSASGGGGGGKDREAMLSANMLHQVLRIADDLRISEQDALTLYAHATASSNSSDHTFASDAFICKPSCISCNIDCAPILPAMSLFCMPRISCCNRDF
jgi:hypothetical protein